MIIPKHFIPPMIVNAALGTVLWYTYSEASQLLESHYDGKHKLTTAAIAGATAGGAQAVFAAPAENVRLALEGGKTGSWRSAWRDVFRGATDLHIPASRQESVQQIRQVSDWLREVQSMAGRGWDGMGWGVCKDSQSLECNL